MSTFQIKHGPMPSNAKLAEGELGFDTTQEKLYIGNGSSNIEIVNNNIITKTTLVRNQNEGAIRLTNNNYKDQILGGYHWQGQNNGSNICLRQYSPNSDGGYSDKYENYKTPQCDEDMSENKGYTIWTTKQLITGTAAPADGAYPDGTIYIYIQGENT